MKLMNRFLKYFLPMFAGDGGEGSPDGGEGANNNEGGDDEGQPDIGGTEFNGFPPLNEFARQMQELDADALKKAEGEAKKQDQEKKEKEKEEKDESGEGEGEESEPDNKDNEEKTDEKKDEKADEELHEVYKKLQDKFKDEKIEPGEKSLDKVNDWLSELTAKNESMTKEAEGIVNMFKSNKDFHEMANLVYGGMGAEEAYSRVFGAEGLKEFEGEPDAENLKKTLEARNARIKEDKEAQVQFVSNQNTTKNNIDAFAEKHGLSDDKTNEILTKANQYLNDAVNGLVSGDFLDMFYKVENIETEKAKAAKAAALEATNKEIKIKEKRLKEKKKGDGLPQVKSGGAVGGDKDKTDYFGNVFEANKNLNDRIYKP